MPGIEDARVLPDDFVHGVTGVREEGFVDEFDACIGVGNGNRFRALADGFREHVQRLLGLLALRDVANGRGKKHAFGNFPAR